MSMLRHDAKRRALAITRGHPFRRDAFLAVLEAVPDFDFSCVDQPAAQAFLDPQAAKPWDAILFYDMPGVDFTRGAPAREVDPPTALREGFSRLVEAGCGLVFLHHAVAGWPTWDAYHDWIGARFLYGPGRVRDREWPDSGYRFDVGQRVTPVDPDHPVVAGLEAGFEIQDECYLCPVFEDEVVPLLRSDFDFRDANFFSSAAAVAGKLGSRDGWSHPPGTNLVAWERRIGRTRVVTILLGDGPSAYENPAFRRLVANAVRHVAEASRAET